jgi:hypothetical protein
VNKRTLKATQNQGCVHVLGPLVSMIDVAYADGNPRWATKHLESAMNKLWEQACPEDTTDILTNFDLLPKMDTQCNLPYICADGK